MAARPPLKVGVELGTTRVFASAVDYPGWVRTGKTEDEAIATLLSYRERYLAIAQRAGLALPEFSTVEVVERVEGNSTTNFGAPDRAFSFEAQKLTEAKAEQQTALLEACQAEFDAIAADAPAILIKGPRGGGRDTDAVMAHVAEADEMAVKRKTWSAAYRTRRRAWHLTDHGWEIQDRSQ